MKYEIPQNVMQNLLTILSRAEIKVHEVPIINEIMYYLSKSIEDSKEDNTIK